MEKSYKMLQFLACGHVDDGKSTLIGRLLHDIEAAPRDQVEAARNPDGSLDFSYLTDGLEDERKQGITIDVAYRFFRHNGVLYRVADTPGHLQYMRNMAVAAINSDLAVVLVDAIHGVRLQTVQYSKIARFFGVTNFIIAVNKMDAVNYDQARFEEIQNDYLAQLEPDEKMNVTFIPVSAICGDNIAHKSEKMPWYTGEALITYLENAQSQLFEGQDLRFPVQYVVKEGDKRWYLGSLHGKPLKVGDTLICVDSTQNVTVAGLAHSGAKVDAVFPGQSVAVNLSEDIDLSRGSVLSEVRDFGIQGESFYGDILWLDKRLENQDAFQGMIKIHHQEAQAHVEVRGNKGPLKECMVFLSHEVAMDRYAENPHTGLFILVDPYNENTVGVGTISQVISSAYQGFSAI